MTPTWNAYPVIDGAAYYVALERDGKLIALLLPDVAWDLADRLEDAAHEPARCIRDECGDYATDRDLCGAHASDPRTLA